MPFVFFARIGRIILIYDENITRVRRDCRNMDVHKNMALRHGTNLRRASFTEGALRLHII